MILPKWNWTHVCIKSFNQEKHVVIGQACDETSDLLLECF